MTALRTAAQQALEALESAVEYDYHGTPLTETHAGFNDAATALRTALAEPDWKDLYLKEKKRADMWRDKYESVAGADQRIYPLAEPVQEPVAWIDDSGHPKHLSHLQSATERRLYGPLRPLYTASPQRKPLTEEEIVEAVREADLDWQAGWTLDEHEPNRFTTLARAIERAHGITKEMK